MAWSLCRATSRWTSSSCPWSTDPKAFKKTAESKFLAPVDGGLGYGANFLTLDNRDPLWDVLEVMCVDDRAVVLHPSTPFAAPRPLSGCPTPLTTIAGNKFTRYVAIAIIELSQPISLPLMPRSPWRGWGPTV